jgi:CRP/FNR family transcriptional regulator, cyclic AMP receptor protein
VKPQISDIRSARSRTATKALSNGSAIFHDRAPWPADAGVASPDRASASSTGAREAPPEVTPNVLPPSRNAKQPPRVLDKLAPLRNHPLFREFPPAVIEHFGTYMTRRSVRRGATIFAKGDPGTGLMAVLWGSVKISVPTPDGREAVLNIINPGEIFGEMALLDGRPRSADAVAMDDCELMVIDRRDFIPFLRQQPDIALKFIEILCARIRHTSEQVEDVMYLSFPGRLAKTLLQLTGGPEAPAAHRNVRITQRELSSIIGMSRESTNKQLRAWEDRKWVRLQRGGIAVLDPNALAKLAAEGGTSSLA